MRGGIVCGFNGIVSESDDFSVPFNHCADGHFVVPPCINRLIVGETHEEGVVALELRGEALFKGTFGRRFFGVGHVWSLPVAVPYRESLDLRGDSKAYKWVFRSYTLLHESIPSR